ncbi:MAG TPA: HAD-IIIC family phosphatase [Pyrinomonadaceae bacterium]
MNELKSLLRSRDPKIWSTLKLRTASANSFSEFMALSNLRKRALATVPPVSDPADTTLNVAIVGGSTLYPLSELVEHALSTMVQATSVWAGEFNNFRFELLNGSDELTAFKPNFFVVIPDQKSCRYDGDLTDDKGRIDRAVDRISGDLLHLCERAHEYHGAEILLCNYLPAPFHDLGEFGVKSPASDWNFKRAVNLALAERAPNYVHICDLEFLAYRLGGLEARDDRSWFESKQAFSPAMMVAIAKETAHIVSSIKTAPKKVLVLDLDNTLWGGVIGDDGIEGIEIGDTSPRGEAFKAFQSYILSLMDRGVLLGVCSKNDYENAIEPFRIHPEMVLREEHIVSFKANWEPKAANLIEMAEELSLGLDSFIFVDDNPAEIEIVKQFAPDVTTILLSDDPAEYVRQLQESRLFERSAITREDAERTQQYKNEADRRRLEKTAVDMDSYLESLDMVATIRDFDRLDLPRIAQLINKSNQFNLTTKRRTEAEIESLMADPDYVGFTVRLADRFGDHGLISIVVCRTVGNRLEIDTWLMSCRVLKRQVEHEVLNEIVRRARIGGCSIVRGCYLPTAKNGMVRDLLPSLGFETVTSGDEGSEFELLAGEFEQLSTFIKVNTDNHANEPTGSISSAAVNI